MKIPSQERIDEIATEFREVLAPRSPAMTTAEQSHLEDYEGFIAIAQGAHALRLLVVEFLRRRYAKLAEAVPEVEVDEWIGKLAAAVSITCCDHAAEFHDQRGCSECPCGSRWSEHPHRARDPNAAEKIAFVMDTAYSETNDDPWPGEAQMAAGPPDPISIGAPSTQIAGACLRCNHPPHFHGPSIGDHPTAIWCTGLGPDGAQCTCTDVVLSWDDPPIRTLPTFPNVDLSDSQQVHPVHAHMAQRGGNRDPRWGESILARSRWIVNLDASEAAWLRERLAAGMPMPASHDELRRMFMSSAPKPTAP